MLIPDLPHATGYRFRRMQVDDAQGIYEINLDYETQLYTSLLRQQTLDDIISWLEYYPHYQRHGFGLWAIEHLKSNSLAGLCGLRVRKDLGGHMDISYRIHPGFRGQGIASAAVKACVDWGFSTLNLNHILAQVHEENAISLHILKKNGFTETGKEDVWFNLVKRNPSEG